MYSLTNYPHLEYPHSKHCLQPLSIFKSPPHSGQIPSLFSFLLYVILLKELILFPFWISTDSNVLAIASGQDSTSTPFFLIQAEHLIPFSWYIISEMGTPDRKAIEIILAVASDCDGHPPLLPVFVNISQMPCSSLLTVT